MFLRYRILFLALLFSLTLSADIYQDIRSVWRGDVPELAQQDSILSTINYQAIHQDSAMYRFMYNTLCAFVLEQTNGKLDSCFRHTFEAVLIAEAFPEVGILNVPYFRLKNLTGRIMEEIDNLEDANLVYKDAIVKGKSFPSDSEYYFGFLDQYILSHSSLARTLNAQGFIQEAILYYKEAIRIFESVVKDPAKRAVNLYESLAIIEMYNGYTKDAIVHMQKVVNMSAICEGDNHETYAIHLHNLGRAYMLHGNIEEAKKQLNASANLQLQINGKILEKTQQYINDLL